jgi:hypothetical protein
MQILFPELKPYKRHQVKVTDKHELYVDEAGNVDGIPILFVHGGPVELVMRVPVVSTITLSIGLLPSIRAAAVARLPTVSLKTIQPTI